MKERAYVDVARMSGMRGYEIIVRELMPNLIPFIVANLVNTTASAILATIGMEALGLGPTSHPTLGMTIYWVILHAGVLGRILVVVAGAGGDHRPYLYRPLPEPRSAWTSWRIRG